MTTFIAIICGLTIGWLLMVNHDTDRRLRRATEELAEAQRRLVETDALAAETARELKIVSNMLMAQKTGVPFGDNYVRPYSLLTKN